MAYVEADYLSDVLGSVTEFETLGWIVYVPKLGKKVILSVDLYNALDEQEMLSYKSEKVIEKEALRVLQEFADDYHKQKEIENDD
ncbi:TPA: hypothetical protein U5Y85_001153 [Streptococcus agalactiae]|nr:hypothetical protein [Streptococcus agalactiae]HEN4337174.1 hypothetical protein [Streptococcus agalactiae]HEN4338379.1 hypothetical protein [Streptococcus agalactiae]